MLIGGGSVHRHIRRAASRSVVGSCRTVLASSPRRGDIHEEAFLSLATARGEPVSRSAPARARAASNVRAPQDSHPNPATNLVLCAAMSRRFRSLLHLTSHPQPRDALRDRPLLVRENRLAPC